MNAIEIRNLKFSYDGRTKILDGIDLDIEVGQLIGIVGDSGCGKSTLCYILCGIIPDAIKGIISGEVWIRQKDENGGQMVKLRDLRLRDMAEIVGFVMQDSDRQIVSSTVEDELAFGPENLCIEPQEIRKRVDDTAQLLGISDLILSDPNNLSGGQKQLVAIGSVLTLRPPVLILDEPFSHLDQNSRNRLSEVITMLRDMGKTVIVVEHDHDTIENADRRICIKDGKIEREY